MLKWLTYRIYCNANPYWKNNSPTSKELKTTTEQTAVTAQPKLMRFDQVCDTFSLNKENCRHFCEVKLFKMNAAMQIDFHGQFPLETVGGISMLQLS